MGSAIKAGVYKNLDIETYHADPALSRSDIVRMLRSMRHFKFYSKPENSSPHFRVGTALHKLVLEGIPPVVNEFDGRTKQGKEFLETNPDAISAKEADLVCAMAEQVASHFSGPGTAEVSYFWEEISGPDTAAIMCKCRPDWINDGVIYDLKTTRRDARFFHYDIKDYSLDVQALWYLRGVGQFEPVYAFRFIVVEKDPPHGVMVYEIEDLSITEQKVNEVLSKYRQCLKTGEWPGYSNEIVKVNI